MQKPLGLGSQIRHTVKLIHRVVTAELYCRIRLSAVVSENLTMQYQMISYTILTIWALCMLFCLLSGVHSKRGQ